MKKYLFLLLLLTSDIAIGALGVQKQQLVIQNEVLNPQFQNGKDRWSVSAGIFTIENDNGKTVGCWDATALDDTWSTVIPLQGHMFGDECRVEVEFKDGDSNLVYEILDGSSNLLATGGLFTTTKFEDSARIFQCPASGNLTFRLRSTADAAKVCISNVFVGKDFRSTKIVSPVVFDKEFSIGSVGSVANDYGPLVDTDFPNTTTLHYYHLNGDLVDDSPNAVNLQNIAGSSVSFTGKGSFGRNDVISFDGVNDALESTTQADFEPAGGTTPFSISTWVKPRAIDKTYTLASLTDAGDLVYSLYYNHTLQTFQCYGTNTAGSWDVVISTGVKFEVDEWQHIAWVYDGTDLNCYYNGLKVGSASLAGLRTPTSSLVRIGAANTAPTAFFDGYMQDLAFHKGTALTEAQVNAIYSKRFKNNNQIAAGHILTNDSFPFSDLTGKVAYWNLSDLNDGSVNAINLTDTGTNSFNGLGLFGEATQPKFTGSSLFHASNALFSSSEFTVSMWLHKENWDVLSTEYLLSNSALTTDRGFLVSLNTSGQLDFSASSDGTSGNTTVRLSYDVSNFDSGWNHITYTQKDNTTILYVNGVEVKRETSVDGIFTPVSGTIVICGAFPASGVRCTKSTFGPVAFSNIPLSGEDVFKLYSAKVDFPIQVDRKSQDWSTSRWSREDNEVSNQLESSFILDSTDSFAYLNLGLNPEDNVQLRLKNSSLAGATVESKIFQTDKLTSVATPSSYQVEHGLGIIPSGVYVLTEGQVTAGTWSTRVDLCHADDTYVYCNLASLTIDATHRVQIIASGLPKGLYSTDFLQPFKTGLLSSVTDIYEVEHGLGVIPRDVYVRLESQTSSGDWDVRRDLCSFNLTTIKCDFTGLGVDVTHRIEIVALPSDKILNDSSASDGVLSTNYIADSNAESGLIGSWNLYDNGAVVEPTSGTGGTSANLTFSTQQATVLNGAYTYKLSKASSVDAQGEGVSYEFIIPKGYRNNFTGITFNYATDLDYVNGHFAVYLYDVDTSTLIKPSTNTGSQGINGYDKDLAGAEEFTATFMPVNTSSINYRFIIHVTNPDNNAFDLYFDDLKIGIDTTRRGAIVGERLDIATSDISLVDAATGIDIGNYTVSNVSAYQVGDKVTVHGRIDSNVTRTATQRLGLAISGLTVDNSKHANGNLVGTFQYFVGNREGLAYWSSSDGYIEFRNGSTQFLVSDFDDPTFQFKVEFHANEIKGSGTVNYYEESNLSKIKPITITPAGFTLNSQDCNYKEIDDFMSLDCELNVASVSNNMGFSLPPQFVIDLDKAPSQYGPFGVAILRDEDTLQEYRVDVARNVTSIYFKGHLSDGTTITTANDWADINSPFGWVSGDTIKFTGLKIPIDGWKNNNNKGLVGGLKATSTSYGLVSREASDSGTSLSGETWNGTSPTTGTYSWEWKQIGKEVTLNVRAEYTGAGITNTQVYFSLPAGAPTPKAPNGGGTNEHWYAGSGGLVYTSQATYPDMNGSTLYYVTGSSYRIYVQSSAARSALGFNATIKYFTD